MTKTAMMVSHDSLDAPLARTFGKAKWLLLWDGDGGAEFRRNEQLSGGSVAGAIAASGCRDVIAAHVGDRACAHLKALGIRLWQGPVDVPVRDVLELYLRGELEPWSPKASAGSSGCSPSARRHESHVHPEHGGKPAAVVQLRRRTPT